MSHALIDALRAHTGVSTDAALARLLDANSAQMCKWRTQPKLIGPVVIRRFNEKTGMPVARIKELAADKSPRTTIGRPQKKLAPAKPSKVLKKTITPAPKRRHQLTVTKTAKWTSTVHRML